MRRSILLPAIALAPIGAGCGSGDSTPEVADSPAGATIEAGTAAERQEALEVQDYFTRNCPLRGAIRQVPESLRESRSYRLDKRFLKGSEAMCGHIASIAVDGKRVTIRSEIPASERRGAGEAFCNLMRGSDVADFTPGHELQDVDGETVEVCAAEPR